MVVVDTVILLRRDDLRRTFIVTVILDHQNIKCEWFPEVAEMSFMEGCEQVAVCRLQCLRELKRTLFGN